MRKIQEVNVHLVIIRHIWGIHGSIRGGNPYQCTVGIFVHLHGIKKCLEAKIQLQSSVIFNLFLNFIHHQEHGNDIILAVLTIQY